MIRYLLALVFTFCSLAVQADDALPVELTPDQKAKTLQTAETTGMTIYRHDRAAAIATDAALETHSFKKDKRVKGWITEAKGNNIAVIFVDQTPAALYRATVSDSGDLVGAVSMFDSPLPLTEYESGAVAARTTALAAGFEPCSEKYNPVVLPDESNNWVVYLLPGTTKHNVVPIGGTYRIETDGHTITSRRGFTRTCIVLPNDSRAVGLMITHLLDATPTEAHVFWSIWAKKSMFIVTSLNEMIWSIEDGKIHRVERGEEKG